MEPGPGGSCRGQMVAPAEGLPSPAASLGDATFAGGQQCVTASRPRPKSLSTDSGHESRGPPGDGRVDAGASPPSPRAFLARSEPIAARPTRIPGSRGIPGSARLPGDMPTPVARGEEDRLSKAARHPNPDDRDCKAGRKRPIRECRSRPERRPCPRPTHIVGPVPPPLAFGLLEGRTVSEHAQSLHAGRGAVRGRTIFTRVLRRTGSAVGAAALLGGWCLSRAHVRA
jgi:hypothetical protein